VNAVVALTGVLPTMQLYLLPGGHHVFLTEHAACLAAIERFLDDLPSLQPEA
jgi:hypothetical protein